MTNIKTYTMTEEMKIKLFEETLKAQGQNSYDKLDGLVTALEMLGLMYEYIEWMKKQ